MLHCILVRGFVKLKKFQKSAKNESGWVGQAPTLIRIFFLKMFFLCVFCVVFMFITVSKKKKKFFSDFYFFLT